MEFKEFPKIHRLNREIIVTEKLDGTNACVIITEDGQFGCQSRNRLITPDNDNMGFARWAYEHKDELMKLGKGYHFGEWWGSGIQRGYGLPSGEKRFSLFNTFRWSQQDVRPSCCEVVPVLYQGLFNQEMIDWCITELRHTGSRAVPFMNPEGIVVFHTASNSGYKITLEHDEQPKSVIREKQDREI